MWRFGIIFLASWLAAGPAWGEVLVMKSGRVVKAQVLDLTGRSVTFTTGAGEITLPRAEVRTIFHDWELPADVETETYTNIPPPTRAALMDGAYEPSASERLGSALTRMKQNGRDMSFFSSAPRYAPAKVNFATAVGIVRVSPPPPYAYPWGVPYPSPYGYPYVTSFSPGFAPILASPVPRVIIRHGGHHHHHHGKPSIGASGVVIRVR